MNPQAKITLSIEENSYAFLEEAVGKALQALDDPKHWQFAILHLVQSLELSLKSLLRKIHPLFVYEDVDKPNHTVSLSLALTRLQNKEISGMHLTDKERRKIRYLVDLRNEITHADFDLIQLQAEREFLGVFSFIVHFHKKYFGKDIHDLVSAEDLLPLLEISTHRQALLVEAKIRLKAEGIPENFVLACPACGETTFVCGSGLGTCYLCHYTDTIINCTHCDLPWFRDDMTTFNYAEHEPERDVDGWNNSVIPSQGLACARCLPEIMDNDDYRVPIYDDDGWDDAYDYLIEQSEGDSSSPDDNSDSDTEDDSDPDDDSDTESELHEER